MMRLSSPIHCLFAPQREPSFLGTLAWWESRRLVANAIVGVYGIACLVVFFVCLSNSGELQPGEDAVEPLALLFAPIGFNICYTAGWIVESIVRVGNPETSVRLGPLLLFAGLAFSLFVATIPAAFWLVVLIARCV